MYLIILVTGVTQFKVCQPVSNLIQSFTKTITCMATTNKVRARKIACPTSRGNRKFQSGNCNFFTYVPAGNHAFISYLAGPGFSINIFVGKMGKINKW